MKFAWFCGLPCVGPVNNSYAFGLLTLFVGRRPKSKYKIVIYGMNPLLKPPLDCSQYACFTFFHCLSILANRDQRQNTNSIVAQNICPSVCVSCGQLLVCQGKHAQPTARQRLVAACVPCGLGTSSQQAPHCLGRALDECSHLPWISNRTSPIRGTRRHHRHSL